MTTLPTIIKIALLAIAIGIAAALLWVPLLRDVPEPLPDRLKWGSGGFDSKCRDEGKDEFCTKEVMDRQKQRKRLIVSPSHAGEWCDSKQDNDCFEGAEKGHLYIVSSEEAK